ncbi:MAG TPA: hypothetical protein VK034_31425 [Enhygromyxa sp.]|nr:hypothetical protein [Enhygromyxa sp.]
MYRHDPINLEFVNHFVDAVTVRPFFEDLRRIRRASAVFRQLPRLERYEETSTEAA